MSVVAFLIGLALIAFLFAAASLLADYLAAHRRTDLPPHLGHRRLGIENEPATLTRPGSRRPRR